ncbi:MAG: hypothetical protein K2J48_01705 [Muribaculaceae bacterium]|nr:hypothetical protein [Muribaculaceae bacterium]
MRNKILTEQIQKFLAMPEQQRDYSSGALLLLQITGNKVQYNYQRRSGFAKCADIINRRLQDILEYRLQKITHQQVMEMKRQADSIAAEAPEDIRFIKAGRRPDHDDLPDEIQAAYKMTLEIRRKQQRLHIEIQRIARKKCSSCEENDLYPFVKEMIKLDKERLALWQRYDTFGR